MRSARPFGRVDGLANGPTPREWQQLRPERGRQAVIRTTAGLGAAAGDRNAAMRIAQRSGEAF